jgi:hypothetical protein
MEHLPFSRLSARRADTFSRHRALSRKADALQALCGFLAVVSHPGFDAVPISGPSGPERGDCSDGETTEVLRGAAASSRR